MKKIDRELEKETIARIEGSILNLINEREKLTKLIHKLLKEVEKRRRF